MSMIDDVTNNLIKFGTTIGVCDTPELRKLKEQNEKSKIEKEIKDREEETVKNHGKCMKEVGEMNITAKDAYIYCLLKMSDSALLEALSKDTKPKQHKPDVEDADADTNVEVPANEITNGK